MIKSLENIARWQLIILFAALTLFVGGYLFPLYETEYEGKLLNPLDLRLGYTYNDVMDLFTKMGETGRTDYIFSAQVIDSVYPWMYGMLLILAIALFSKKVFSENSPLKYLSFLPLLIISVDYAENYNTVSFLKQFPEISEAAVTTASFVTTTKWILVGISISWLLVVVLFHFFKQSKIHRNHPTQKT